MIAEFAHANDTAFGRSWISRLIIWFGFTISFIPILLVHLDYVFAKGNKHVQGIDGYGYFENAWLILILIQSFYVFAICPLMIVFYESNERLSIY
jgi:hypothetical protein